MKSLKSVLVALIKAAVAVDAVASSVHWSAATTAPGDSDVITFGGFVYRCPQCPEVAFFVADGFLRKAARTLGRACVRARDAEQGKRRTAGGIFFVFLALTSSDAV